MIRFDSKFGRRVKQRIKKETIIWLITVGTDLTPQPRPVWFLWDGETFLIFSKPNAHKLDHIKAHPKVALSLNCSDRGDDVAVILGTATIDLGVSSAHKVSAYLKKYRKGITNLGMSPEEFGREYSVAIRVTPLTLRGF